MMRLFSAIICAMFYLMIGAMAGALVGSAMMVFGGQSPIAAMFAVLTMTIVVFGLYIIEKGVRRGR